MALRLLADVGGTNSRFALQRPGGPPERVVRLANAGFPGLAEAAAAYLREMRDARPTEAALAVASPATGAQVTLTNRDWSFHQDGMRAALGVGRLVVVNDFVAAAHAVPALGPEDCLPVGGGEAAPGAPVAVLGPGTGLGVAALVRCGSGWTAVAGEGGHATMPAVDEREAAVLARLALRFGHVSAERCLSGPGLVNLLGALREIEGEPPAAREPQPPDVVEAARADPDSTAGRALAMFWAMLGTFAGDVALTFGARGGVYLAGGIVPALAELLPGSAFSRRFQAKGRFGGYLAALPVHVVMRPDPALLGLARLMDQTDS